MSDVRSASLNAHAAARSAPEGSAARFAARACGQAVATAHVPTHSLAAAWYAAKAVWAADLSDTGSVRSERGRQYQSLAVQVGGSIEHVMTGPKDDTRA